MATSTKRPAGRPKTGRNGSPLKLYINPAITEKASKLGFNRGTSISDLVEKLIAAEWNKALAKGEVSEG